MTKETLRMQMLSGVITESEYKVKLEELNSTEGKDSLNENFVGMTAINSPFADRKKEKYEDAFEYFLNSKYELNEAEETKVEESMGNSSDEEKAQFLVDMTGMSYEDALMKVRQGAVMEEMEDGMEKEELIEKIKNLGDFGFTGDEIEVKGLLITASTQEDEGGPYYFVYGEDDDSEDGIFQSTNPNEIAEFVLNY